MKTISKNDNIVTVTNNLNESTYYYLDERGRCYLKVDEEGNTVSTIYEDSSIGANANVVSETNPQINDNNKRFIELISYQGSSLDPHEIFIKKNMQNVTDAIDDNGKILASVHTVPYIAREKTVSIFEELESTGLDALCIGKPNEYTYNARIEKYNFGYVLSGGLNPVVAIKENGIPVEVKTLESIMNYNEFEEL